MSLKISRNFAPQLTIRIFLEKTTYRRIASLGFQEFYTLETFA